MKIGEKVSAFLKSTNVNVTRFSHVVGWTQSRVTNLIQGKEDNSIQKVHRLVTEMECDLAFLVDESKSWPPTKMDPSLIRLTEKEIELIQWIRNRNPDVTIETVWNRVLVLDQSRVTTDRAEPNKSPSQVVRKKTGA